MDLGGYSYVVKVCSPHGVSLAICTETAFLKNLNFLDLIRKSVFNASLSNDQPIIVVIAANNPGTLQFILRIRNFLTNLSLILLNLTFEDVEAPIPPADPDCPGTFFPQC